MQSKNITLSDITDSIIAKDYDPRAMHHQQMRQIPPQTIGPGAYMRYASPQQTKTPPNPTHGHNQPPHLQQDSIVTTDQWKYRRMQQQHTVGISKIC